MNPELEKLIDLALADGQLTEKEKQILNRKAQEFGVDMDEFEMVLEGKFHLAQKTIQQTQATPQVQKKQGPSDINELTQEDIDQYVADTEYFWKTFHKSLTAPFHPWHQFKDRTSDEWINICWNSEKENQMVSYFVQLLFEYPVLKGEYVLTFSQGELLTNYRIVINTPHEGGIHNIPLSSIIHFGLKKAESFWGEDSYYIEYSLNGQNKKLVNTKSNLEEHFKSSIVRNEFKELNEAQN